MQSPVSSYKLLLYSIIPTSLPSAAQVYVPAPVTRFEVYIKNK